MTIDITIGAVDRTGDASGRSGGGTTSVSVLEGRILSVRRPRRKASGGSRGERRRAHSSQARDPLGAQVVTLLIPDGHLLPENLVKGSYRALVRFVKR